MLILTISLKIDKPMVTFIFPLIHAINNERIAFAKSVNNKLTKFVIKNIINFNKYLFLS